MTRTQKSLVRMATRLLRLYVRSWRITLRDSDGLSSSAASHRFGEQIYAIRERDLVAVSCLSRYASFLTLIAQGSDGDWAAIVAEGLGSSAVRGSSRHDPAASAMAFVRSIQASCDPAFLVVDGPLGPSGVAKEGIGAVARFTRRPVVPTAAEASVRLVLRRTWSQMVIPLPFSRVTISLGAPIEVSANADRPALERVARLVSSHFAPAAHPGVVRG